MPIVMSHASGEAFFLGAQREPKQGMAIVTGDRYLELLARFVQRNSGSLLDGVVLKLNPVGLLYLQTRLESLEELEQLRAGAPVDYLRAYVADLGDHRALEQLRRMLQLLTAVKLVSLLPRPTRDPTPITLLPFARLRCLELRGCDLSTCGARGLLELRPTLEKLVCYNSAEALRHIFAERTAEIQDAKAWTKLTVVSCPCNGMLLMDESLQLLPVVEVLDLSRNCIAEVANLQKCSNLRYLDLGFNQITNVSSLNMMACNLRELILRNNALVSIKGIEQLVSLEVLDISNNLIASVCDVEALTSLPRLSTLCLQGNPLTLRPNYRIDMLCLLADSALVVLDGMKLTSQEVWLVRNFFEVGQVPRPPPLPRGYAPPVLTTWSAEHPPDSPDHFTTTEAPPPRDRKRALRVAVIEDDHVPLTS